MAIRRGLFPVNTPPPTARTNSLGSPQQRSTPGVPDGTPNPAGPRYPWSVGGDSEEVGVPDNWDQYYPTEGHGRGDSWIGPKMELRRDAEVAGDREANSPALSLNARRRAQMDPAYAKLHPEALSGNPDDWPGHGRPPERVSGNGWFGGPSGPSTPYNDPHHQWTPAELAEAERIDALNAAHNKSLHSGPYYQTPERLANIAAWEAAKRQGSVDLNASGSWLERLLRQRGIKPGPLTNIGGGVGSGGYWDGTKIVRNPPTGSTQSAGTTTPKPMGAKKAALQSLVGLTAEQKDNLRKLKAAGFKGSGPTAEALVDYQQGEAGKQLKGQTGETGKIIKIGGRTYRLNKNGSWVDWTDPKNRERVTTKGAKSELVGRKKPPKP